MSAPGSPRVHQPVYTTACGAWVCSYRECRLHSYAQGARVVYPDRCEHCGWERPAGADNAVCGGPALPGDTCPDCGGLTGPERECDLTAGAERCTCAPAPAGPLRIERDPASPHYGHRLAVHDEGRWWCVTCGEPCLCGAPATAAGWCSDRACPVARRPALEIDAHPFLGGVLVGLRLGAHVERTRPFYGLEPFRRVLEHAALFVRRVERGQ